MKYVDLGLNVLWEDNSQGNIPNLPNKDQIKELLDKCDWEPCRINDKDGYKIISKINNNFIFIPFPNIKMKYKIRKLIPQWQAGISSSTKQVLQRLIDNMQR